MLLHGDLTVHFVSQGVQIVEIAGVVHIVVAVREQIPVQIDEVIVGHAGDVVHDDLVGLGLFVGDGLGVMGLIYIVDMVLEDGGVFLRKEATNFIKGACDSEC